MYDGEVSEAGLPHGYGRWMDDHKHGEILTGWWQQGVPLAPFVSREVESGNTFVAVNIGYFRATDDPFAYNNIIPRNNNSAVCGLASVECSVYVSN